MGHEARTAHDGGEAVVAAEQYRPDLILLDIGLPVMNGYEVAAAIRGEPWGGDVVIVALTGWGQEGDRRRSKEAGIDHHLVKPVDPAALERLLAELRPGPDAASVSAEVLSPRPPDLGEPPEEPDGGWPAAFFIGLVSRMTSISLRAVRVGAQHGERLHRIG